MRGILPKLTREYILEHITQEEIFSKYLDIPISTIHECLNRGTLIKSPLRIDNDPTCGFYYSKDRLRFNDFAGYFHGDCFDVVGSRYYLFPNNSVDFSKIKDIIARDFNLHIYQNIETEFRKRIDLFDTKKKNITILDVETREWLYTDESYWKKYNITIEDLMLFDVFPVYSYYINGQLSYNHTFADPCYGFFGGEKEYKYWQLYMPFRKSNKFITNYSRMRATKQIKNSENGILTKSVKDAICIYKLGINSASLASETVFPTQKELFQIDKLWKNKYCLTDYDYTGIKMANRLKRSGFKPLFFTNGKGNTINYGAKDISDMIEKYGFYKIQKMFNLVLELNTTDDTDFYDFLETKLKING